MTWLSIRKPLDIGDVNRLEKEMEINLPDDYKQQIGPINGGALRNAYIELHQLGKIPYARNIALHKEAQSGIWDLIDVLNEENYRLFPFASVGNGDYFCFDLLNNAVVLYLHETQSTVYVCDTFSQLIDSLIAD